MLVVNREGGRIMRLTYSTALVGTPLPPTLADTGAFADLKTLTPQAGIVPDDLNVPFWSDQAGKTRWFSLPRTNLSIGFSPEANWSFPTGDVWIKYGEAPGARRHLLITSHIETSAKIAAAEIYRRLNRAGTATKANIAFLQGVVAASLTFEEVLRDIVPLTDWWHRKPIQAEVKAYRGPASGARIQRVAEAVLRDAAEKPSSQGAAGERLTALDRYAVLAGLMLWAADEETELQPQDRSDQAKAFAEAVLAARPPIGRHLRSLLDAIYKGEPAKKLVFQISLNRKAGAAVQQSVLAVKGDAAKQLFTVDCSRIAWAIIDSGVDAAHPAFKGKDNKPRIVRSYDFTRFRRIVSLSNIDSDFRKESIKELRANRISPLPKDADRLLRDLAENSHAADDIREVNWDHVEKPVVTVAHRPELLDRILQGGRPAPRIGEHTQEVLAGLGCTPDQIETLRREGVV